MRSAAPEVALGVQLRALLLLAPVSHASVWLARDGVETCVARVGWSPPGQRLVTVAREALDPQHEGNGAVATALWGVPLEKGGDLLGALVVQARRGQRKRAAVPAGRAATAVAGPLEQHSLVSQAVAAGERLLDAAERRIARLGFDIHDGPLQRLSLVAGDLATLDRLLGSMEVDEESRSLARRRVGDVAFILGDVQRELRDLTLSAANSGTGLLSDDLAREVLRFRNRTGVQVHLDIQGDVERTTRSQRLAVHRIVEESLANVGEHGQASEVSITLRRDDGLLRLTIRDDGRGFDVRRALRRASRDGRLGLVAMAERVRFLGGELDISSSPGGPTVVSATLPAWTIPRA